MSTTSSRAKAPRQRVWGRGTIVRTTFVSTRPIGTRVAPIQCEGSLGLDKVKQRCWCGDYVTSQKLYLSESASQDRADRAPSTTHRWAQREVPPVMRVHSAKLLRMRWASSIVMLSVAMNLGCTSSPAVNSILAASATVAASAILRAAAQGGCYATCGPDTQCNHKTGMCVPTTNEDPCAGATDPTTCVPEPPKGSVAAANEPFVSAAAEEVRTDECAGLCFDDERCVIERGELACVRR
jgi:hypothetical protein